MQDSAKIVPKLIDGEHHIFRGVFKKYYLMLFNLSYQYLEDEDEAKEVVQEAYLKLWETKGSLKSNSNIQNYLFTIVKNNCLNRLKRKQLLLEHHEKIRWMELQYRYEGLNYIGHDYLEFDELKKKIEIAINNLPEHCQRVFKMSRFDERKNAEIAQELGVTVKTVEAHLTKALKILRKELKEYLPILTAISQFF